MSDQTSPFEDGGLGVGGGGAPSEQEDENTSIDEDDLTEIRHDSYTLSMIDAEQSELGRLKITLPSGQTCSLPSPPENERDKRGYKLWQNLIDLIDGAQKVIELSGTDVPSTQKSYIVGVAVEKFLYDWIVGGDESDAAKWYRRREEMWTKE